MGTRRTYALTAFLVAVTGSAFWTGCEDDDETRRDARVDSRVNDQGLGARDGTLDAQENLTDVQVKRVLTTINTGEIEQGQLALEEAETSSVRTFAGKMVGQHTAANASLTALIDIGSDDSALSIDLSTRANAAEQSLSNETGLEFDRAYIDLQVLEHQEALQLIDSRLLPTITDDELRTVAQSLRQSVQDHLAEAQTIRQNLGVVSDAGITDVSSS